MYFIKPKDHFTVKPKVSPLQNFCKGQGQFQSGIYIKLNQLSCRMEYREYEIAEPLKPYVKVIWSMESDSNVFGEPIHILPDTCVELVIHFGDPIKLPFQIIPFRSRSKAL